MNTFRFVFLFFFERSVSTIYDFALEIQNRTWCTYKESAYWLIFSSRPSIRRNQRNRSKSNNQKGKLFRKKIISSDKTPFVTIAQHINCMYAINLIYYNNTWWWSKQKENVTEFVNLYFVWLPSIVIVSTVYDTEHCYRVRTPSTN